PLSLGSMPVRWKMSLMKLAKYDAGTQRDQIQVATKGLSDSLEGSIQAELNRMFRRRDRIW
ncbi:MAG: hypothetical protein K8F91_25585, partial [Candidatus Obscuribacterales bacterium]|nr:hypothetical protein [Candidatus Obscuribacterales bacterium]